MDNVAIEVKKRITENFGEDVRIDFHDEKGDGKHFMLYIISENFEGMNRIKRSQFVYSILDDLLKTDSIHALRMNLKTPNEL